MSAAAGRPGPSWRDERWTTYSSTDARQTYTGLPHGVMRSAHELYERMHGREVSYRRIWPQDADKWADNAADRGQRP